jgi:hypothetical protein
MDRYVPTFSFEGGNTWFTIGNCEYAVYCTKSRNSARPRGVVRFEAVSAVLMEIQVLWDVTPCRLVYS